MEKHLYIDFSHLAYRCLFANAGTIKTNGWGIMRHLLIKNFVYLSEKFEPNQVFICFDSPTIWRKSFYPEYKATRKAARDKQKDIIDWKEFFNFLSEFKVEIREIFPFYCLEQEGLEADDVIAYLTRNNPDKNKTIVTSDGDYVQLLRFKNTSIYDPLKDKMVTGVNPVLELEKKILTGDKSDNVPPIKPRLGEKTAEKLISSGQIDLMLEEKTSTGEYVELRKNYDRNKKLVDLTKTPVNLLEQLQQTIDDYVLPDGKVIFTYLKTKKLRDLLGNMQKIRSMNERIIKKDHAQSE